MNLRSTHLDWAISIIRVTRLSYSENVMNINNHNYIFPLNMKRTISLAILLFATASTNANAFFFFFLPGSVTSKISDAFTGSEGDSCVMASTKVGDVIPLPNGGIATVKSLSGTSYRCTDPTHPIRALVDYSTSSFTSKAGIDLPDGWESIPVDQQKANVIFSAKKPSAGDTFLIISAWRRGNDSDMMTFATNSKLATEKMLEQHQQSEIVQITVNGMRASRFEITGTANTGNKYTGITTILEGDQEIVIVAAFSPADSYEEQKEEINHLPWNIKGIHTPALPAVASPAPVPVATPPSTLPTQSESAASKLRALNALYKDGVINQNDFETKKQEILKSM